MSEFKVLSVLSGTTSDFLPLFNNSLQLDFNSSCFKPIHLVVFLDFTITWFLFAVQKNKFLFHIKS